MRFSRENHLGIAESASFDQKQEEEDYFEKLPDDILLLIFNKVLDAKSLVRCVSVSKRFNGLVPQTDAVFLPLPRKVSLKKKPLKNLLNSFIPKSIRFLQSIVAVNKSRPKSPRGLPYYSPNEALKGFKELKSLHLEVPESGLGGNGNDKSFVKWEAEFGTNLQSCVILGANSVQRGAIVENDNLEKQNDNGSCGSTQTQPVLTDEELKLRIVWIISSLIAASARHYLLKRVVADSPALANVVVSDERKRGKLYMGEEQIAELRSNSGNDVSSMALESSLERSLLPDLSMKLWYVPQLELPRSGCVIEGATLVVIRPLENGVMTKKGSMDGGDVVGGGFDGNQEEKAIFGEAVGEMMKMKKTYVMEMTSF